MSWARLASSAAPLRRRAAPMTSGAAAREREAAPAPPGGGRWAVAARRPGRRQLRQLRRAPRCGGAYTRPCDAPRTRTAAAAATRSCSRLPRNEIQRHYCMNRRPQTATRDPRATSLKPRATSPRATNQRRGHGRACACAPGAPWAPCPRARSTLRGFLHPPLHGTCTLLQHSCMLLHAPARCLPCSQCPSRT